MPRGLVVYDSRTGNTEKMALAISRGMAKAGLEAEARRVEDAVMSDLVEADAIALGSPTYFANVTAKMKDFIDRSVEIYPNQLEGKVGAAFTSWAGIGAEPTLLSLIMALFLHRMTVVGHQSGDFGAISQGDPDDRQVAECEAFGERIASVALKLAGEGK